MISRWSYVKGSTYICYNFGQSRFMGQFCQLVLDYLYIKSFLSFSPLFCHIFSGFFPRREPSFPRFDGFLIEFEALIGPEWPSGREIEERERNFFSLGKDFQSFSSFNFNQESSRGFEPLQVSSNCGWPVALPYRPRHGVYPPKFALGSCLYDTLHSET